MQKAEKQRDYDGLERPWLTYNASPRGIRQYAVDQSCFLLEQDIVTRIHVIHDNYS